MKKYETDLKETLEDFGKNLISNFNCHSIAKVLEFNKLNQTAKVQIQYKKNINGKLYSYPVLIDCPCVILSGGNATLRMPISIGDECLVLFNDRDIDNWFESGTETVLNSDRLHDLSDGIILVGIRSLQKSISDYTDTEAGIVFNDTKVLLDTKIKIENASRNLKTLINSLIDEIANTTIIIPSGSSAGTYPIANKTVITALKTSFGELLK